MFRLSYNLILRRAAPSIPNTHNCGILTMLKFRQYSQPKRRKVIPFELVIFDKDGTLIEFGTVWTNWTKDLLQNIKEQVATDVTENALLAHLGYDVAKEQWDEGLICDTPPNITEAVAKFLQEHGCKKSNLKKIVQYSMETIDLSKQMEHIKAIDDPQAIFRTLRYFSIKTAICTTDSRDSTERMLEKFKLTPYVDLVLCGDDHKAYPKPDPRNLYYICERLNVQLDETVYIGDSTRDIKMGNNAEVGLAVGVLSGVCTEKELHDAYAGAIIPSIIHLFKIVLYDLNYVNIFNFYRKRSTLCVLHDGV